MKKRFNPRQQYNHHREDPRAKPPPGWKVENILWQRLNAQARRMGCQSLIQQVDALRDASRSDIVVVLNVVAQAAKGESNPAILDLQKIIAEARGTYDKEENTLI